MQNGSTRVVFDLETGGLEFHHPIIQIAAVAVDADWEPIDSIDIKIDFDPTDADPTALKVNSYDETAWAESAVDPKDAVELVREFLAQHASVRKVSRKGSAYYVAQLVGHNAATFDFPRLKLLFEKHGAFLPASFLVMDTLALALWYPWTNPPVNFKLGTVAEKLGVTTPEGMHDALVDVLVTAAIAKTMSASISVQARLF